MTNIQPKFKIGDSVRLRDDAPATVRAHHKHAENPLRFTINYISPLLLDPDRRALTYYYGGDPNHSGVWQDYLDLDTENAG